MVRKYWLLFGLSIIFLIALSVRLLKLKDLPSGFTPDEAAQGYTAYSILKTGRDEWGIKLPVNPRSFGDFKAPVYTYLLIPSIAVFGLNEIAVRFPNALLGSLSVLVVFFLVRELLTISNSESTSKFTKIFPLAGSLILALSPWHVSLSRGGFEFNLPTFFLPLGILLFIKGLSKHRLLPISAFVFGLNFLSYHSAKVVTPLIVIFLLVWQSGKIFKIYKNSKSIFLIFFLILLTFLIVGLSSYFFGAGSRVADIGIIFSNFDQMKAQRYFAYTQGLPSFFTKVFINKLYFPFQEFITSYFSYVSPYFLFTQGAGEATYGMIPGYGLLYLIEAPFLLYSLYLFFKEKQSFLLFLWFWFLISPIPASLSRGVGYHASRVAIMVPSVQILTAYGIIKMMEKLPKKMLFKTAFFFCAVYIFSSLSFLQQYFFVSPLYNSQKMFYGWRDVFLRIADLKSEKIVIGRNYSEPQAFAMFYGKLDPVFVQKETINWLVYERNNGHFVDQMGNYRLGKYEFRDFSFPEDWHKPGTLLIGNIDNFLIQEKNITQLKLDNAIYFDSSIFYPNGNLAFRIIEI